MEQTNKPTMNKKKTTLIFLEKRDKSIYYFFRLVTREYNVSIIHRTITTELQNSNHKIIIILAQS